MREFIGDIKALCERNSLALIGVMMIGLWLLVVPIRILVSMGIELGFKDLIYNVMLVVTIGTSICGIYFFGKEMKDKPKSAIFYVVMFSILLITSIVGLIKL